MTVRHAQVVALVAVVSALVLIVELRPEPVERLEGQREQAELGSAGEQRTLDELRVLAEKGDAAAQTTLGLRYMLGDGVPQDDAEAVRWFRLAAEQEHADAQMGLAGAYQEGRDVPQDNAEALRWGRLAANQDDEILPGELFGLGLNYENGTFGLPQNDAEAARSYRLAAERGYVEAQ